ncbi:TfuA-like protein [Streptomyces sp. NPDC057429]|uniref:TfuA-like protein n=1 Tax=Streptomyces sp. NPDC057429 TaxID=3346130 RepID=UPI00368852D5
MIHIFVGPTLDRSAPPLAAPGVRVCPPAQHGDLFTDMIEGGDMVVLVDGVFHQAPALRHKEILAAMGRGVRVIGAASIGALRAAELAPFGMTGVGAVYAAYARGEIAGDDEVAVGQDPDGDRAALTWPVVNLRHSLDLAVAAGVLDGEHAGLLLEVLRAVYYPQRTMAAVRAVCDRAGGAEFVRWLSAQRAQDRHFGDIKRADALMAVTAALDGREPSTSGPLPPEVWESAYFRRWSNTFARERVDGLELSTEDRVLYQQVFAPAFGKTWADYLEHRSLHPADEPGRPLAERLAEVTDGSLTADRIFHPPLDLRDAHTVAFLLAGESEPDRRSVAHYARALDHARHREPGFSIAAVREDLTRRLLLRVWRCPQQEFDAEASARGLVCGARAVHAAKRFVPGLLEEIGEAGDTKTSLSDERTEASREGR